MQSNHRTHPYQLKITTNPTHQKLLVASLIPAFLILFTIIFGAGGGIFQITATSAIFVGGFSLASIIGKTVARYVLGITYVITLELLQLFLL